VENLTRERVLEVLNNVVKRKRRDPARIDPVLLRQDRVERKDVRLVPVVVELIRAAIRRM
jgi:hypothetical protein